MRREQLENERVKIMENLEKVKNGDITSYRKGNQVAIAKAILNDMNDVQNYNIGTMREKLEKD